MQMDWHAGKIDLGLGEGAQPRWRLTSAADWAPKSDWGAERKLEAAMIEHPKEVYGDVLPFLRNSDLNIVNVETVLGAAGQPLETKALPVRYLIRGDERAVAHLQAVPFDVACLANNHTLDFGSEGLARTIQVLQQAGLKTVGAGMDGSSASQPLVIEVKGITVAIINCAEGEHCRSIDGGPGAYGLDLYELSEQIRRLKEAGAVVIVFFHGGREYAPLPPPYVVRDLRRLAEMGASAVIAHHPHVPQGMEFHNGVPVVYSQGNFLFWQRSATFYRRAGYVVHLDFCGSQLNGVEITPYLIAETGIRLMKGNMREQFAREMTRVSALLKDPAAVRTMWNAMVDEFGPEQVATILEEAASGLRQKAAMQTSRMGNLFRTPAGNELFANALERATIGTLGHSPAWARELVRHWSNYLMAEAEALDNI